ncbi:signal peptidase I [Acaricomes phytoseiuli]|uniref:signal peptidase I n=1 Tax=Acaricomes phytoseiuli TaxID=291968 RepID=UPI00036CB928|nr:signal peptidase I [Acaricomes phytoseiuli]MCW1250445.1 signal peptidase I [Acaricomes phytoseiuli]
MSQEAAETPDAEQRAAKSKTKKPATVWTWLREIVIVIVIALALSFLIKTFLFRPYFIPSPSMELTLQKDDRIFVNVLTPQFFPLQRGDIVVFKDTQNWLPPTQTTPPNPFQQGLIFVGLMPDQSQQHLVKRIIGMPGDQVSCCDVQQRITVNGTSLNEPYLYPGTDNTIGPNGTFNVTVPDGKLWVMGDNRNNSADSRAHQDSPGQGFVSVSDVEGVATVIAWPINRWTILGNYPETFSEVPAPSDSASSPEPAPAG